MSGMDMNRNKFQIIKNLGQMLLNLTEAGVLNLLMILNLTHLYQPSNEMKEEREEERERKEELFILVMIYGVNDNE